MSKNEFYCDCTVIHEDVLNCVKSKMLTTSEFDGITKFFKAIGDKTRVKILWAIYNHEMCVCDLANLLSMTNLQSLINFVNLEFQNLLVLKRWVKPFIILLQMTMLQA